MLKQDKFTFPQRYKLPSKSGDIVSLGQLTGAAYALECAHIADKHSGPVILITSNIHSALKMHNEIKYFTSRDVITLSDWETLPYDSFSPHKNIISERLFKLYHLPQMKYGVFIISINNLMQRVCPCDFINSHSLIMQQGQLISLQELIKKIKQAGYRRVNQVIEHGEFAIRGTLIDLYPMGSEDPYRIDVFNDTINILRILDVNSQKTLHEIKSIHLLPAHEFPIDKHAIQLFHNQWIKHFKVCHDPKHIYQQVSKGVLPTGIEYWQPLFFSEALSSLFSYFPCNALLINIGNIEIAAKRFWSEINQYYDDKCVDPMRPLLKPDKLWLQVDELCLLLKTWPRINLKHHLLNKKNNHSNLYYQSLPELQIKSQYKNPLDNLKHFINLIKDTIVFIVASEGRRENLLELLSLINISPLLIMHLEDVQIGKIHIMQGVSEHGFINLELKLVLICEQDLLGNNIIQYPQDSKKNIHTNSTICNFNELNSGHLLVHLEHGVGRYNGMIILEINGIQGEYLILTYADNTKLYVPISSLHLLSRYTGIINENTPLHKLGGNVWNKTRQKAIKKVRDIAAELLDIYALRATKIGYAFKYNHEDYQMFCQSFPFKITTDQNIAINAVLKDMCQPLAMDRLICGDVGFGKTEVAMRAAFLAVNNNKQVAVLVPTTLLAQQHYDNFCDRFANWPVRIEMLSRFRSTKEQIIILQDTVNGKIDILIGTHKLLHKNMQWNNLALLIVDEEHRFGVRHKEQIKAMRTDVDILTLTATPIPRTLNMAMNGMRDLSIIATPPARRLAVKTFVRKYNPLIVREAILREITRGGQVYYLYNDVESIDKVAKKLSDLVPEAFIKIAHGQMRERELEHVINDFYHQRFNVLICTTIIETGIDIPSANTIIIERADHFGLAQLYQLRGRVGRSFHQAYAYLFIPRLKDISTNAQKRIEAITSLERLGAGFMLATHDLEIRGAGELLGDGQSGQISSIGFSLYMELLESTIDSLKKGQEPSLEEIMSNHSIIEMHIPALLPNNYIPDVSIRLSFYKRIASAKNHDQLRNLKIELIDRFGLLPCLGHNLLQITKFRLDAIELGVSRIECHEKGGFIEFRNTNNINPIFFIELLQKKSHIFSVDSKNKLYFIADLKDFTIRLDFISNFLMLLKINQVK
ncbi:Transcription-repair-coupling factor [Candidatus Profftia lariciata]|uniref:transcription-repair coupling factor n=1 Tax=Candidatus Profftia lariciata TaxID=1987921 RepID=UPI001D014BBE|nr:transcription-repair coupling factor [Candidatus Profftia lariciata]UDG81399.1 Transcription-repair-coupling factor [Candidatus Profftia lariciata]